MKRIYVSTVGRGQQKEESSKVYSIDYDTGKILHSVKLPHSMLDLSNPRGGCRGARGLCWDGWCLWAAGFDGLFKLDSEDLHIYEGYWFKEAKDIHQIYYHGSQFEHEGDGCIALTATFTNEVKYFDIRGRCLSCVHEPMSESHPGEPAPEWFPGCKDTLHVNAISNHYVLCAKPGVILERFTGKVLTEQAEYLKGSHDIWELPTGEVAINNSKKSRTVFFDPDTWEVTRIPYDEQSTEGGSELAKRGWTRGMYYLPHRDLMFIGSSPAEIIVLADVCKSEKTRILNRIPISDKIVEATFDVLPHPWDWQ